MRKIILLIIILLCTGCTINYEVKIDNSMNIQEKLYLKGNYTDYNIDLDSFASEKQLDDYLLNYNNAYFEDGQIELLENIAKNRKYSIKVKTNKRNIKEISNSMFISYIYNDIKITKNKKNYVFNLKRNKETGNEEYDYDSIQFDELYIKIKTSKMIINSNADSKSWNEHTWKITNDNIKDIHFEVSNISSIILLIPVILFVSIVLILSIYIYKKSQKVNEIN